MSENNWVYLLLYLCTDFILTQTLSPFTKYNVEQKKLEKLQPDQTLIATFLISNTDRWKKWTKYPLTLSSFSRYFTILSIPLLHKNWQRRTTPFKFSLQREKFSSFSIINFLELLHMSQKCWSLVYRYETKLVCYSSVYTIKLFKTTMNGEKRF